MAKKLTKALGVDIGSRSIKVAEISAAGPSITAIGMIDTPEGSVDHTGIYNPEAVGAALKTLLGQIGASVNQAVVSIEGQQSVLVRTLEVPNSQGNEFDEHMDWELNRNNPFAEANPIKDYRRLPGQDPNAANVEVVMAIASPMAVETLVSCVKKAGKQASAIDVEPLAIARTLSHSFSDEYRGKTICVVNVGHKSTSINIYRDGVLLMPRQIPVGGENFTKAISDGMTLSVSEAEEVKKTQVDCSQIQPVSPGFSPFADQVTQEFQPYNPFADDAAPVAPVDEPATSADPVFLDSGNTAAANNAIANELDEFAAEIRRSIDYFRSRGNEVDRLALCGGGSALRGLGEYLSRAVGLPCDRLDPLQRLNLNARKADPAYLQEHAPEFTVAVGNGLHIIFD
jgi:type IV pilus assembly protein PilM